MTFHQDIHPTTEYALSVMYGDCIFCKWELLACQRHIEDLQRSKDPEFNYVFDESRADRVFNWFENYCNHVRGPFSNENIILDSWQKFILGCVFGWVHKSTGVRRFLTAYIRIARGNAKSTLMSGIANYGMCADALYTPANVGKPDTYLYENQPEVACVAVDREQAAIVWGDAREMALASPKICTRLDLRKTTVKHRTRGGSLRKLSKDTKNKDGGAPCFIVVDEYHAHPTSLVKDVTSSGKGKRAQCLEFIITTAGEDAENKPCKIEDDIVKSILEGRIPNERYFGIIFELDKEDDPHDSTTWLKANPILQSKNPYTETLLGQIQEEHDLAFGSGDNSKKRQWMIKRVDLWQYDSEERYMGAYMDCWHALAVPREDFYGLTRGAHCIIGVDLSTCLDLTATGYVFKLADGRIAVTAHGFVPEEKANTHEKSDRVPYKTWAVDGYCTLTEGAVTDDRCIIQHIKDKELDCQWRTLELCYDPYSARQFANVMQDDGYECVEIRQGVQTLSEPTKKFRELVIQKRIVHDGNPILAWCIANAVECIDNNGNIKLSKKNKDDSQRIDLLAAIINAMVRIVASDSEINVYETRGMRDL